MKATKKEKESLDYIQQQKPQISIGGEEEEDIFRVLHDGVGIFEMLYQE